MRIGARRGPRIVSRIRCDADESFRAHFTRHPVTELRVSFDNLLWNVRFDWLHVRRQEQSRTHRTLLMYVVDDLWMPNVVNLVDSDLRLNLCECIPVAIVIVAGGFVVST